MEVKLINGLINPEKLVARAARNDYLRDGVIEEVERINGKKIINKSMDELMDGFMWDGENIRSVCEDRGYHPSKYLDFDSSDMNIDEQWDNIPLDSVENDIKTEAKWRTLIDNLMDSGHWGPFEHPQAVIAINGITRVVTHQLVRHRHFSFDQQSLRYVGFDDLDLTERSKEELEEMFQFPDFRGEDFDVDREGVHEIEDMEYVEKNYKGAYDWALNYYLRLRKLGVPKEQARKVLPMGIKTNIVMSGNARAWMHILNVRKKADVQGETRRCADAILEELKEWMPYTFKKYEEDVFPMKLNP